VSRQVAAWAADQPPGRGAGGTDPGRSQIWWKRLTLLFAMLVTGISIIGYVALSVTVNALPPLRPFPGWVALLEPVSELGGEQVLLKVQSNAVGSHPFVSYTVVACGRHPYRADLLIGGSAQLTGIQQLPSQYAAQLPALRVQRLSDLVLGYIGRADFGAVQLIHVSLPQVSCAPTATSQAATGFFGAAESLGGFAAAPIHQSWRGPWGWWHGPHTTQAWPLTGTLPGTSVYGAFTGLAGLRGQWIRPDAKIEISAPNTPLNQSIDRAIPMPSDPAFASWSGMGAMNPVARLSDTSSMALLQDWIVVFAVGLGIGGGMLASLLFEWLRPHPARKTAPRLGIEPAYPLHSASARRPVSATATSRRSHHRGALIVAMLIIGWVRARRARHRS
jgi:hypothetical protein